MITKDLQAVKIDGQLEGTTIDVTIHEVAMGHVMYQLANLYNDPILAFIRESATNGFDATVEEAKERARREGRSEAQAAHDALNHAKGIRPVEVTLPSRLAPMFIVRDYGTGMDYAAI